MRQKNRKIILGLIGSLLLGGFSTAFAVPGPISSGNIADGTEIESTGTVSGIEPSGAGVSVTGGNNIKVTHTEGTGTNGAIHLSNLSDGNISLGSGLQVTATNTNAGIAQGIFSVLDGHTVTIGDNMTMVVTNGAPKNTATIFGAVGIVDLDGQVLVGDNASISVEGYRALGIYSWNYLGNNAKIEMGSGLDLTVSGEDAVGVAVRGDGIINLAGGTIKASGENSAAMRAGSLPSGVGGTGGIIGGTGVFNIEGDMYANNSGTIDLTLQNGSQFTGKTTISGGTINLNMDGTTWNMTGDSSLSNLTVNNGTIVNFNTDISGGTYGTLTMDTLAGTSGQFNMREDIANMKTDLMVIGDSGTGTHTITIPNNGSANVTGNERLTVVDTTSGSAAFAMNNVVELGGYQYNLRQNPDNPLDWEIYGKRLPVTPTNPTPPSGPASSHPADAGVNIFSGAYLLNYAEMNTLMQRMGELREGNSKGNVWARTYGGKFDRDGDGFLRGFDMDYWGIQVGADKKLIRKNGNIYVGGMFGYTDGDLDYERGSGSLDSKSIGAYGTYVANNGFYADLVLKYNWMKGDFRVRDSQDALVKAKDIKSDGFTASAEVGQKFYFDKETKEGWYVEPQAQLSFGHYSGDDFTASNGLRIDADSYNSFLGRLGANVGYEIKGGKNPINGYAKLSVVHEFDGDVDYRLNGSKESTSYDDTWVVYGLGVTAKVGEKHNLYLDVERSNGGDFTQKWALNVGYRFTW